MFLLNTLLQHGQETTAHGAAAGQAAEHGAAAEHAEHVPIIVEKLNDLVGPAVFEIQKAVMPPVYKIFGFRFGDHLPGENLSYQQYRDAGNLPIPTQVVMFLFVVLIAVVVLTLLRGKLSAESPTGR